MSAPNPASQNTMFQLVNISKSFGSGAAVTKALRGATCYGRSGELLFLIGPSGCGKTTLLSILAGTLSADDGEVMVMGENITHLSESARTSFRAKHLGFIFQQFNLIPTLSVLDNVSVPLLIQGLPSKTAISMAKSMLEQVGLGDRVSERPMKLSGGQQQRVAIARALVHKPRLIVCDEPTSALDSANGKLVMELLKKIVCVPGTTVVVVTHDSRIYSYADRMLEMEDGKIIREYESREAIAKAQFSH